MSDLMRFYMAATILQWIRRKYSSSGKYGIQCVSYLKRNALVLGDITVSFHQYLELLRSEPTTQGICTYRPTKIINLCPLLTIVVAFINISVILSSMSNLIVNWLHMTSTFEILCLYFKLHVALLLINRAQQILDAGHYDEWELCDSSRCFPNCVVIVTSVFTLCVLKSVAELLHHRTAHLW